MPIKGHLEDRNGAADARGAPRRTLLLATEGSAPGRAAAPVLVRNISATGLLLDYQGTLPVGETIAIELPEAGRTSAEIVWCSDGLYGCRFAAPLSPAALSAAQLRSLATPDPVEHSEAGNTAPTMPEGLAHEALSARIQRLRKDAGLTLAQLAERLGVSKPTVWAWEQGRARPVDARMAGLAIALGVSEQNLLHAAANPEIEAIVTRCRAEIAVAFGTSPEKVRIMVEL